MGALQGILGVHERNGGRSQARNATHWTIPNTQNATITPNHRPTFGSRTGEEAKPSFSNGLIKKRIGQVFVSKTTSIEIPPYWGRTFRMGNMYAHLLTIDVMSSSSDGGPGAGAAIPIGEG